MNSLANRSARLRPHRRGRALALALWLLVATFLALPWLEASEVSPDVYGADANPTGAPIGGGAGYDRIVTGGDYTVSTVEELLAALAQARPGQIVYVAPGAELDLTGKRNVHVPNGVTLAGNRGAGGSPGPLLFTDELDTMPLFVLGGPQSRITGLRLRGPDGSTRQSAYEAPNSEAIRMPSGGEVDNNEIFNWSYAGVNVSGPGAHIHHNYIHHVRRAGLGYPVVVNGGSALIEANKFDWYRHAIAGNGVYGTAYEARYNWVGPNATSHAFDMHGGGDFCPKRSTPCTEEERYIAGQWVSIHHNTFLVTTQRAIRIRGVPVEGAEVYRNIFADHDPARAYSHVYYLGNASVYDNLYGPNRTLIERWLEPSPLVRPCLNSRCAQPGDAGPPVSILGPGIEVGIVHPRAGEQVRGSVPVSVVWETGGLFRPDWVRLSLEEREIYAAPRLPAPGEVVIDTTQLPEGRHTLTLEVTDERYGTLTRQSAFVVDNLYELVDRMDPPIESGWFGVLVLSKTSAESDGWEYAPKGGEAPLRDAGRRRVAQRSQPQFLQWATPALRTATVTLYVRDEAGQASPDSLESRLRRHVGLLGSEDGERWLPLPYTLELTPSDSGDWTVAVLTTRLAADDGGRFAHVRLTVDLSEAGPLAVEVGEARFTGDHASGAERP